MSDRAERTWTGDWETRLRERVTAAGYRTPGEFLAAFPGEPFVEIVKRLGDDVAAVQLTRLHFMEAFAAGDLVFRHAARDALARSLNRRMPSGWKLGGGVHGALAEWETNMQQYGGDDVERFARAIGDALLLAKPAPGWRPLGPADPLLSRVFDASWPVPTPDSLPKPASRIDPAIAVGELDEVVSKPFTNVSGMTQILLAQHAGQEVGYLSFLRTENEIARVCGQAIWMRPFRSGLLVFGSARNGDAWALDLQDRESVVVLSHDLILGRQVENAREGMLRVADSLEHALQKARARTLPIDYWAARDGRV